MPDSNLEIDRRSALKLTGSAIAGGGFIGSTGTVSAEEETQNEIKHVYACLYASEPFFEIHRESDDPEKHRDIEKVRHDNALRKVLKIAEEEDFAHTNIVLSDDIRTLWMDEDTETAQYYFQQGVDHPTLDVANYSPDLNDRLYIPGSQWRLWVSEDVNAMQLAHNLLYDRLKQHFGSIEEQREGQFMLSMTLPKGADYTKIKSENKEILNEHNTVYTHNKVQYATYLFDEEPQDVKVVSGSDEVKFVIKPEKMY